MKRVQICFLIITLLIFIVNLNKNEIEKVPLTLINKNNTFDLPLKIMPQKVNSKTKQEVNDNKKSLKVIAQEAINGKWGNGEERKKRLTEKGYDYYEIQKEVNNILAVDNSISQSKPINKSSTNTTTTTTTKKTKVTTKSFKEKVLEHKGKLGTEGRLYLPSMFSVALYYTNTGGLQKIVDDLDSAVYYPFYNTNVIADHAKQGFRAIRNLNKGNTIYIKTKSELKVYKVIERTNGVNTSESLVTNDGRDVRNMNIDLVMYTCNDNNSKNITLIFLKKEK